MPKQLPDRLLVHTLVIERLRMWGATVRRQRVAQRIRAVDLCARLGISDPTLRRLERGESSVSVAVYLGALQVLGLLDQAAPPLSPDFWEMTIAAPRTRAPGGEGDDYF